MFTVLLLLVRGACPAPGPVDPRRLPGPTPVVGPTGEDLPTRIRWLKQAMQLLIDQCAGRAPLTPYADLKLPCSGRDVPDSALGLLDITEGNGTAACMTLLRKQPGPQVSFNGQAWPAIWYRCEWGSIELKLLHSLTPCYLLPTTCTPARARALTSRVP